MWALRVMSWMLSSAVVHALNFPYESTQLTENDTDDFSALSFGNASTAPSTYEPPACKVQPEDEAWPSEEQWARFNSSIEGQLLKPHPVGEACYPGPAYDNDTCAFLVGPAKETRFFFDDPLSMLTTWGEGATCLALLDTTGRTCTQGGFPVYVVNATSVRDIQAAVNFARNQNLRLVIKNTGHDFIAKSTGRGALSVWTHYLKGIEFLDDYSMGEYHGPAARIGAALEAWEASNAMVAENRTVAVPLDASVGYGGGWVLGGGHGPLTSLRGLGADQVLSLNVVTADGRFVTADLNQNTDLFFALRGGGGSTFGIVTSTVVKAWPGGTRLGGITFFLTTGPGTSSIPGARGLPAVIPVNVPDAETFWKGYRLYLDFAKKVVDAGGFGFGDVNPQGNDTYVFVSTIMMPDMTTAETKDFIAPLFESLRDAGIDIPDNYRTGTAPYAQQGTGVTPTSFPGSPADRLFISRLLPRALWANATRLDLVADANRKTAEMGYRVTTRAYGPTAEAAGYPGNSTSAVNPAMRDMVIHCVTFKQEPVDILTPEEFLSEHARLRARINVLRDLTPDSGTYFNEADRLEPDWQNSFWGDHYPRLMEVKKTVDPWNLFWAPHTVGSEGWEVDTANGLPTQDGPLCRIGDSD